MPRLTNLRDRLNRIKQQAIPADRAYAEGAFEPAHRSETQPNGRFCCPVCGGRFDRFLPFGLNRRPNAQCPGCGSLERDRFLWLHISETLRWPEGCTRLLHVAPELCLEARFAAMPGLRYTAIDRHGRSTMTMDLTRLGFADGCFDGLVCSHVLEHIVDDYAAIAEITRVLAPGGRALIMVPLDRNRPRTFEDPSVSTPAARHRAFGHPFHVRICGADYGRRLGAAGLMVREILSTDLEDARRRCYRINRTELFDCQKPNRPA